MALLRIGRSGFTTSVPATAVAGQIAVQEAGSDTFSAQINQEVTIVANMAVQETGSDTVSFTGGVGLSMFMAVQETGSDTVSVAGTVQSYDPTLISVTFTDNNDGTAPSLQAAGGYIGADQINATIGLNEGATLRATVTETALAVVANAFSFSSAIDEASLVYEVGSSAADIPNVDSVDVTIVEANNGGASTTVNEAVSGLSVTPPVITWATNAGGTQFIGTGDKALFFSQDVADWTFGGVTAGAPTVDSVTGSGTTAITIIVSGNLPVNSDTLTISYTDSDTGLRGPDGNAVADFAGTSVTNNVAAGGGLAIQDNFASFSNDTALKSGGYTDVYEEAGGAALVKRAAGHAELNTVASGEESVVNDTNVGSVDHYAEVDHVFETAASANRLFVIAGADGTATNGYLAQFNADGNCFIRRLDDTSIASGTFTAPATGTSAVYRIERDETASTVTAFVGGTQVMQATSETTHTGGQKVGFGHRLAGGTTIGDGKTSELRGDPT